MKITKRQQQFIKDATVHPDVCSKWVTNIKDIFPKLFVKEEYTESGWYLTTCGHNKGYLCYFTDPSKSLCGEYWLTSSGAWGTSGLFDSVERLATNKEVETALISEAKRRGFKEGVKYTSALGNTNNTFITSLEWNGRILKCKCNGGGDIIFKQGKWATIIETITKEQAEKELGKTIID